MNIDGFVHDGKKKRFLLLEFKWPEEKLDQAAEWAMTDFATIPNCLAMAIRILGDDNYRVKFFPTKIIQEMNGRTLRHILADWWNQ